MSGNGDHFNKGGMIAFLGSFGFVILFMGYVLYVKDGIVLDTPVEVGSDVVLAKEFDPSSVEKVWVANQDLIDHGSKLYSRNCATCHGEKGEGNGVAAGGMVPAPRNLVAGGWKNGGDEINLFKTLQNGIAGGSMASYKAALKPGDRWALVHFIQSITKDKSSAEAAALTQFAATAD